MSETVVDKVVVVIDLSRYSDICKELEQQHRDALFEETIGGIHLWPSPTPIRSTRVSLATMSNAEQKQQAVDKRLHQKVIHHELPAMML